MDLAIVLNEEGAKTWNPPSFESDKGSGRWMQGGRDGGERGREVERANRVTHTILLCFVIVC